MSEFKNLYAHNILSAVERACKWQHNSYYWEEDEWGWIIKEIETMDEAYSKLEKENERLNQQGAFFAAKSEELERKLEVAVDALWALVDDIDSPFRLGLSEKPNPEWHNLNRARHCLREIGE
jgi:hypothetical protein